MSKIIGIIVVFASVLGGFLLSGGKIGAIIQPFEVLIIGGAALGRSSSPTRAARSWWC